VEEFLHVLASRGVFGLQLAGFVVLVKISSFVRRHGLLMRFRVLTDADYRLGIGTREEFDRPIDIGITPEPAGHGDQTDDIERLTS